MPVATYWELPHEVHAIQFVAGSDAEVSAWLTSQGATFAMTMNQVVITQPGGVVTANRDDWIMRDAAGTWAALSPAAFTATYIMVEH